MKNKVYMYFVKTPKIVALINKNLLWEIPGKDKIIYLTFDDGPEKDVTPGVLKILDNYNAKATFFCLGNKTVDFPEIISDIRNEGHSIGNHSFSHLNGRKINAENYVEDVMKAKKLLNTSLFRPPYGKITPAQISLLKKENKIILWSVMPGDFDKNVSKEKVLKRSIKHAKSGSVIVFHENPETKEKMLYALPEFLKHFINLGYQFNPITSDLFS